MPTTVAITAHSGIRDYGNRKIKLKELVEFDGSNTILRPRKSIESTRVLWALLRGLRELLAIGKP